MADLKLKILKEVQKIKKGDFSTYKEIAKKIGKPKASLFVASVLARNKDLRVPCHRVVKNDHSVGGYNGLLSVNKKNSKLSFENLKLALLLKEGVSAVMPTDTIYGICTSALDKKAVEKVYKLRKRNPSKPFIILISDIDELKIFGIKLDKEKRSFLQEIWPSKISIALRINNKHKNKTLFYLHRGTNFLAFRLPAKPQWLIEVLKISGPLIAPSANWESYLPAKTIKEAKRYFSNNVIYYNKGKIVGSPSTLIRLDSKQIEVLRKGSDFDKLKNVLKKFSDISLK
jgi:L-threonylcarbamoyladenylate synthase